MSNDEAASKDSETDKLLLNTSHAKSLRRRWWIPSCWYIDCFPCIKARYVLTIMTFLGFCNVYALRVNLSVAIVQMTAKHPYHDQRSFDWSNNDKGWVLSAFYYGYFFTQIPGGWLATRYGGKYVFGIGILMTSLLTLITPQMADINIWVLVAVRIVIGLFEGVTFPAFSSMFGKWAPPLERSIMGTIAGAGPYVGNIIAFPISGELCKLLGWPWVFYCFGFAGIAWFVLWLALAFNTPSDHPRISPEELYYIESSIEAENLHKKSSVESSRIPWRSILTSPVVLGLIIANFSNSWGFYTLLTCLPTFFKQTLCLDIQQNGFYSAIPYACLSVILIGTGQVTDLLRYKKLVTTTFIRKCNFTVGTILPAVFLLLCGYYGSDTKWAIIFLSISVGCVGFSLSSFNVNILDIAPKYAGILMGLSNMIATISGFVGPQVANAIVRKPAIESCGDECTDPFYIEVYRKEWQLVFIIAAEMYVFGAVAYLILGSGEKQSWAEGYHDDSDWKPIDDVALPSPATATN